MNGRFRFSTVKDLVAGSKLRAIRRRGGGWLARRIAGGGVAATFGKRHEDVGE
jgi:hypothetical protein